MVSLIEAADVLEIGGDLPSLNSEKPVHIGPIAFQLVSFLYRSDIRKPETGKLKHVLIGPDAQELNQQEFEVNLEKAPSGYILVNIPALRYAGLGLYFISIHVLGKNENEWLPVARLPLQVRAKLEKAS